jgi:glycerol-3-phosphate acyltransferase PlsY
MELFGNMNIQLYLAAYLISGIPFGYLLGKYIAGVDIKSEGSGNIGATNVLRVLKSRDPALARKLGAATLFLDAVKGVAVILAARAVGAEPSTIWTLAVLSVLGHCFSPFLNFEGGKGVATGFGVLLFLLPVPSLVALSIWFAAAKLVKISSLSSLMALGAMLLSSHILYSDLPGTVSHAPIWIIALTIFYKHIPNLIRLVRREEAPIV